MPWFERVYERNELYALVWSKPLREVAKHYVVSDVTIKNVCRKLRVPTPPQGHWIEVAAGADVVRAALPPLAPSDRTQIVVSWWRDHDPILPSDAAVALATSYRSSAAIGVCSTISNPHRTVARSGKLLAKAKPFDGLVSSAHGGLDIKVAPANVDRALRIMDTVIKALEEQSLRVEAEPTEPAKGEVSRTRVRSTVSGFDSPSPRP